MKDINKNFENYSGSHRARALLLLLFEVESQVIRTVRWEHSCSLVISM